MFITVKLVDSSVRTYETLEEATEHSVIMNRRESVRSAFYLYKSNGRKCCATYLGKLTRRFGNGELYWDKLL